MRILVALLALAALVMAGDEKTAEKKTSPLLKIDPKLKLPLSEHALPDKPGWGVIVNLDAEGKLTVAGKQRTLAAVGEIIGKEGEKTKEDQVSGMRVLLRVDEKAPWAHAQWLMIVCALNKVYKVEYAVMRKGDQTGYLKCWLPIDMMGGNRERYPVRIHVVARAEKEAAYGELKVTKPTKFVYRSGKQELGDDLGAWIGQQKKKAETAKLPLDCEIRAGRKVPWGKVVGVLDLHRANKIESVNFYGTQQPHRRELHAKSLPYPKKNYGAE
ncbi:MAG: ExbD/TolR family protein [Planctomycetota bacterium]|jgi:biopolymer transport protein ExbD